MPSFDNSIDNRGLKGSYIETGPGWAQASSAPFRYFKSFVTEGGIRAPLIIKMPGQTKHTGKWNKSFLHVTDIMPTLLKITGTTYPEKYKQNYVNPLIGKSLLPILNGTAVEVHQNDGMGYELFEMKAYIKGKWKILRLPIPMGSGEWELYDLEQDPGETNDLSLKFDEIKKQLIEDWNEYAKRNEVYDHNGHYDSLYQINF